MREDKNTHGGCGGVAAKAWGRRLERKNVQRMMEGRKGVEQRIGDGGGGVLGLLLGEKVMQGLIWRLWSKMLQCMTGRYDDTQARGRCDILTVHRACGGVGGGALTCPPAVSCDRRRGSSTDED